MLYYKIRLKCKFVYYIRQPHARDKNIFNGQRFLKNSRNKIFL